MFKGKYYIFYVAFGIVIMANYRRKNPLDTIQDACIFFFGVLLLVLGLYLRVKFRKEIRKIDDFYKKSSMRLLSFLFFASFIIGCVDKKASVCNCCAESYSDIDSAMNCIDKYPIDGTSADERMLLLAFTSKEEGSRPISWNIINDPEIIKVAKRNYLMVVLNVNDLSQMVKDNNELIEVINSYEDESLFFVIVNQAYYPFGNWKNDDEKSAIIGALEVGNGP